MTHKSYNAIMVGYAYNHTRYTYKLYNPDTNRVIMTRDVKWTGLKMIDQAEILKMFRDFHEEYLASGRGRQNSHIRTGKKASCVSHT